MWAGLKHRDDGQMSEIEKGSSGCSVFTALLLYVQEKVEAADLKSYSHPQFSEPPFKHLTTHPTPHISSMFLSPPSRVNDPNLSRKRLFSASSFTTPSISSFSFFIPTVISTRVL